MRAKRPARVLVLLLAVSLLPATGVLATHTPQSGAIVALATNSWGMKCGGTASEQQCTANDFDGAWYTKATIRPGFGASLFAFFHILIGPTSGYLADLTAPAWLAALGVFAAFGAFTVLFWAWFRFRPSPAAE